MIVRAIAVDPQKVLIENEFDFANDYDNTDGWLAQMAHYYTGKDEEIAEHFRDVRESLNKAHDIWLLARLNE